MRYGQVLNEKNKISYQVGDKIPIKGDKTRSFVTPLEYGE